MSEKRRIGRRLAIIVAAVIVLVIAAVLIAPLVIPSTFIASEIAALVHQKTGRDLRIAGPISFSLLPRPALVARDVRLASPDGGFTNDFLTAETVDLRLDPGALLHGRIEIDHLAIIHPVVSFEIDPSGERNWIFRPVKSAPSTSPQTSSRAAPSFAAADITLTNGAAIYLDDRNGSKVTLAPLTATGSLPRPDGPISLHAAATYNAQPVQATISLSSPAALNDGDESGALIAVSSPRGNIDFHGKIGGGHPSTASGEIQVKIPSLRDLLAWLRVGGIADDTDLGGLWLNGNLDVTEAKLSLADSTVVLDGVTAKGALAFCRADGRSELDATDLAVGGGKAAGVLVIDAQGATARGKLTGITVGRLPIGIAGFDALTGTGNAQFDLTGTGKTMRQWIASLNGSARLDFTDGSVASAGLAGSLRSQLGPALSDKAIPREIAYRSLSASATITQGVLHNDDLKLAGPQVSASGSGTLDLAPHHIDYVWRPDITGLGSAQIEIAGDWANPAYKVDSVNITGGKGLAIPGLKLR